MKLKASYSLFVLLLLTIVSYGQQQLIYSQYFLNPYLLNPSFLGSNGYMEVDLNFRKQWSGIQGAPQTSTFNFQLPLSTKTAVGFTAYQDKAGILNTTTGLVSFAYQVYLGKRTTFAHKIGFGLSVGLTNSRVNLDEVDNPNDPSLSGSTSSMDGQAGVHYQFKNLKLAFAIPRIFQSYVVSENGFNQPGLQPIKNTISSASYIFKVSPKVSIEPYVLYRTYENQPSQFEGLAVARINNIGWLGGSYRQDYGATAFLGFDIKDRLKVGYAYEFATAQTDAFGKGTHEVQLVVRLGKKKFEREIVEEEPTEKKPKEEVIVPTEEKLEPGAVVVAPIPTNQLPVDKPKQEGITKEPAPAQAPIKEIEKPIEKPKDLNGVGLSPGHYVVVGAFRSVQNAKNYAQTLKRAGYPATVAFYPDRDYYIVHMGNASSVDQAKELRDKYRQMSRYSFRDTWILNNE